MKITARVTPETAAKGAAAMRAAMQAAAELSRLGQQYPTGRMPAPADCPTCSGPVRRTTNMVCPTCGTDYAPETLTAAEQAELGRGRRTAAVDRRADAVPLRR